jgi:hypothetical protein
MMKLMQEEVKFAKKCWMFSLLHLVNSERIFYCRVIQLFVLQVTYLAFIGGQDDKDTIIKIMGTVMGNNLAKEYNYHGKKSKKPFKDLQLAKVVYGKCKVSPVFINLQRV